MTHIVYVKSKDGSWKPWGTKRLPTLGWIEKEEFKRLGFIDIITIPEDLDRYIRSIAGSYYMAEGRLQIGAEIKNYVDNLLKHDKESLKI